MSNAPWQMNAVFDKVTQFTESRARSLFSDFSSLEFINPEGFDANISAWELLLVQCLREHTFQSSITLPADQLLDTLASTQYGQPKSLDLVVRRLIDKHVLVPWSIYKYRPVISNLYIDFLSPRKIWMKLASSLDLSLHSPRKALLASGDYYLHLSSLVIRATETLEYLEDFVKIQGSYLAKVLNFHMVKVIVRELNKNLSDTDLEAILLYLSRDLDSLSLLYVADSVDGIAVRVGKNQKITSEDLKILRLKESILDLENRRKFMERLVDQDIPLQLRRIMRTNSSDLRLKNLIIKKSQALQSLKSIQSASNELSTLLSKIDQAKSNSDMLKSLLSASSALSAINQRVSLSEIDLLATEIEEQISLTDKISDAMHVPICQSEDEFDEELRNLETEHKGYTGTHHDQKVKNVEKHKYQLAQSHNTGELETTDRKDNASQNPDIDNLLSTKLRNLLLDISLLELPEDDVKDNTRSETSIKMIVEN